MAAFIIIILLILLITAVYQKSQLKECKSRKRLEGRTVLVTGGTSGIGLEMAKDFAHRGARVIIACPFENEGTSARREIVKKTGNENVQYKFLDLGSLASVREFAADIMKTEARLDILMNNAGVGSVGNFLSKDGINFIMQVNFYGHYLLTFLILPLLKRTGTEKEPARIVNTSSLGHLLASNDVKKFPELNNRFPRICPNTYSFFTYCNSKLAFIYFAKELTKRLQGSNVVVNCVSPGIVGTEICIKSSPVFGYVIYWFSYWMYRNAWQGAQTGLHAALDDEAGKVSGEYFASCGKGKCWFHANNSEAAKTLWTESRNLVKLSDTEYTAALKD